MHPFTLKQHISIAFIGIAFCLLYPMQAWGQNSFQHQKDSLLKAIPSLRGEARLAAYDELLTLYFQSTIDSTQLKEYILLSDRYDAEIAATKDIRQRSINMINTIVFLRNNSQWEEIYKRAPGYSDFLMHNEQWDIYYGLQSYILNAYLYNSKLETTIQKANELYCQAQARSHDTGISIALFALGRAYCEQKRYGESIEQFEQGLAIMNKQEKVTPTLMEAYWTYCAQLINNKEYKKALEKTQEYEAVYKRYQQQIKRTVPTTEAVLLRLYAHAYTGLEELDKAEACLNQADSLSNDLIGMTNSYTIRSEISQARQQYDLALEQANKAQQYHLPKRDEVEVSILKAQALILSKLGRAEESYAAGNAALLLSDTLSYTAFNNQLEELRTRYEVDTHIAEKEKTRTYLFFALAGCILLAVILGIWIYYSRLVVRKNRGLYRQIKEQDRLAKKLMQMKEQTDEKKEPEGEASTHPSGTSQQQEYVSNLRQYLLTDRNFANPDINTTEFFANLATNRTSLFEAVKAVTGKTLMEYIRFIQLDEAKQMLETHPELTIETISGECGFKSSRTFYRHFREQYNISPTEYRKFSREQS